MIDAAGRARIVALVLQMLDVIAEYSPTSAAMVSTINLPSDARDAAQFNRACRRGDVAGAVKRGRVWMSTLEAWNGRRPAPAPKVARKPRAAAESVVSSALLDRLSARRSA